MGVTALHQAASNGEEDNVKLLLEQNANPNAETYEGITPLLAAVAASSLRSVQLLVNAGARPNVSVAGTTPLHIAAFSGNPEMVKTLLDAGADPNAVGMEGLMPIQVAACMGNRAAVTLLFPVTSEIQGVPEWNVDGLIEHMKAYDKARNESIKARELTLPNRSLCWLHATADALADAKACRKLRPSYMEGATLRLMLKFVDAATSQWKLSFD